MKQLRPCGPSATRGNAPFAPSCRIVRSRRPCDSAAGNSHRTRLHQAATAPGTPRVLQARSLSDTHTKPPRNRGPEAGGLGINAVRKVPPGPNTHSGSSLAHSRFTHAPAEGSHVTPVATRAIAIIKIRSPLVRLNYIRTKPKRQPNSKFFLRCIRPRQPMHLGPVLRLVPSCSRIGTTPSPRRGKARCTQRISCRSSDSTLEGTTNEQAVRRLPHRTISPPTINHARPSGADYRSSHPYPASGFRPERHDPPQKRTPPS